MSEDQDVAVAEAVHATVPAQPQATFVCLDRRHRRAPGKPIDRCHDRASLPNHRHRAPLAPRTITFKHIDKTKRRLTMNTLRHANHCRRLRTILRVACFIASAALLSMNCRLHRSSSPGSQRIASPTAAHKSKLPSRSEKLRRATRERSAVSTQKELGKQLLELKDRLLQLSRANRTKAQKQKSRA